MPQTAIEDTTAVVCSFALRTMIVLNFVRFALSFWPWFEGSERMAGYADQLFNPHHADGFRSDFVWLVFSTVVIFFATLAYLAHARDNRRARINAYLGAAWIMAFIVYIGRTLATGLLDFG